MPANVILKPIKKKGSEYVRLIFCKENILANSANNSITSRNLIFFKCCFFLNNVNSLFLFSQNLLCKKKKNIIKSYYLLCLNKIYGK